MLIKPKKDLYEEASSLLPEEELLTSLPEITTPSPAQKEVQSPDAQEPNILELYKQQMQKMEEETSKARTMDEISSLVNTLAPALSARSQARAIISAGSLGADPGPNKVNLKTNRAEEVRSAAKDRMKALLDQYKLTSQLKGKQLTPEEQRKLEADIKLKEAQAAKYQKQANTKAGDNLTEEQKELQRLQVAEKRQNILTPEEAKSDRENKTKAAVLNIQLLQQKLDNSNSPLEQEKIQSEIDKNKAIIANMDAKTKNIGVDKPVSELERAKTAKLLAETDQLKKDKEQKPNIFEKKQMEKFATAGVDYLTKDRDQLTSNVDKITKALDLMKKAPSGPVSGPFRGLSPDLARQVTNPEAITTKEYMQSAIQETLRPILGAQFTENEGKKVMQLAYNDQAKPSVNIEKAETLKAMIQKKIEFSDAFYQYLADNGGSDKGFPYEKYGMRKASGADQGVQKNTEKTILLQSPDGSTARVKQSAAKKYLDKGAKIIEE